MSRDQWMDAFRAHGYRTSLWHIKTLIAQGYDPRYMDDRLVYDAVGECFRTPADEKLKILKYLIEEQGCEVTKSNCHVGTQLLDDLPCLDYLLKNGLNPDLGYTRKEGVKRFTILSLAVIRPERDELVPFLLERGANPKAFSQEALLEAVKFGFFDIATEFLARGCDLNAKNGEFFFTVMMALFEDHDRCRIGVDDCLERLNFMLENGARPLHHKIDAIEFLESLKKSPFTSAAREVIEQHFKETVGKSVPVPGDFFEGRTLTDLRKRTDVNGRNDRGLIHAARAGRFADVIDLVKNSTSDDPDDRRLYPMDFLYCDEKSYRVIDYLGERGQLHLIFTPEIWKGRYREAEALYEMLCRHHKAQVDIKNLRVRGVQLQTGPSPQFRRRTP